MSSSQMRRDRDRDPGEGESQLETNREPHPTCSERQGSSGSTAAGPGQRPRPLAPSRPGQASPGTHRPRLKACSYHDKSYFAVSGHGILKSCQTLGEVKTLS